MLNELRVQYARRHQFRTQGISVDGPAITVTGMAEFGGARIGDGNSVGFDFNQGITQVIDNVSLDPRQARAQDRHRRAVDRRRARAAATSSSTPSRRSTRTSRRRAAPNPFALHELAAAASATSTASYNSAFYGLFVQDDWQIAPQHQAALRRALRPVRRARGAAVRGRTRTRRTSRSTRTTSARAPACPGRSTTSARTVVRASIGLMYEPPLLDFYDNAILNNGDPTSYNVGPVLPTAAGAPAFPASLATPPPGFVLPQQSINAVDPELQDAVGVAEQRADRARARQRPGRHGRLRELDRPQPAGADGHQPGADRRDARRRPADLLDASRATRVDPTFNHINMFKSIGESTYNAFTATLTKRMTHGWMAQATYTLARGVDNAPLTGTYVVGSGDDRVSDPTNLDRDKGVTPFNQTHTLVGVGGARAAGQRRRHARRCCSTTTSSAIILQANSGLPFNIRSNLDLNKDGVQQRSAARHRAQRRPARPRGQPRPALLAVHPVRGTLARGAVLRGEEPVQHREHRRRQPGRHDRRARQSRRPFDCRRRLSAPARPATTSGRCSSGSSSPSRPLA